MVVPAATAIVVYARWMASVDRIFAQNYWGAARIIKIHAAVILYQN